MPIYWTHGTTTFGERISSLVQQHDSAFRFMHEKLINHVQAGRDEQAYAFTFILAHYVGARQRQALARMDTHAGEQ